MTVGVEDKPSDVTAIAVSTAKVGRCCRFSLSHNSDLRSQKDSCSRRTDGRSVSAFAILAAVWIKEGSTRDKAGFFAHLLAANAGLSWRITFELGMRPKQNPSTNLKLAPEQTFGRLHECNKRLNREVIARIFPREVYS